MIKENKVQCKRCGDILISDNLFERIFCTCGAIYIEGGTDYLFRGADDPDNIIELSTKDDEIFIIDLGELV